MSKLNMDKRDPKRAILLGYGAYNSGKDLGRGNPNSHSLLRNQTLTPIRVWSTIGDVRSFASLLLLALPLLTADIARADLITFTATFSDGSKGVGSFHLTDPCVVCTTDTGLDRFAFSAFGNTFDLESITYLSDQNALSGSLKIGNDHLVFTPSGRVHYLDGNDRSVEVWHGGYDIDAVSASGLGTAATGPIVATPEPSSSALLLATAFAVIMGLNMRKKPGLQRFGRS